MANRAIFQERSDNKTQREDTIIFSESWYIELSFAINGLKRGSMVSLFGLWPFAAGNSVL